MISIVDCSAVSITAAWCDANIARPHQSDRGVEHDVVALIDDVRARGVAALREQAERFDGVSGHQVLVEPSTLAKAATALDPSLARAINESVRRVRTASEAALRDDQVVTLDEGATVRLRFRPVDRAGVYIPGGKAVYPSSVVMNVVAAQVAGVSSIALVSPPQAPHGEVHPTIAATAHLLGVDEVYAMGGAGAIAALAYGLPELGLEPVSVITGPGNRYVSTAKRLVSGVVGIDSEAGPTEIVIIADTTAPAEWMAADLVSQAEHDELAQAILITTDPEYASLVRSEVARQVSLTPNRSRAEAALSGDQSAIFVVGSVDDAVTLSDYLAPEHLEIVTADAEAIAERISHAGALFLGPHTPVSAGDYLAGSNHVLPTGRSAKHQSGLSPLTFMRSQQVVTYTSAALARVAPMIIDFARAESLPAHADAVSVRTGDTGSGGY